jgi:cytochrome P450
VAGFDTVSQGCTALFRHIVGDKTIQTRLRAEINAAFDVGDDYDSVKLAKLPFLDACVQEMLRLVPPVAAGNVTQCFHILGAKFGKYSRNQ